MPTAIVVGASMAGMLAARVLSDTADRVIVLERDQHPVDDSPRRGVPQGRHAHALLAAGEHRISEWFPGIVEDLIRAGAVRSPVGLGYWWQDGGYRLRGEFGEPGTTMSRPLLENTVRRHLEQRPNVTIRSGVSVKSLEFAGGAVIGVRTEDERLATDLVVDCSGRNSRLVGSLVDQGYPQIPVSSIQIGVSYGTRIYARSDGDLPEDATFAMVAPTPPQEPRGGVLLPIERNRWILTMAGLHGDSVPVDEHDFLAFARSLPSPVIADFIGDADPLSPVMIYRYPSSQRRRFERVRRHPVGYIGLGDVMCSFNPIYGQGMSSAALQATELGAAVAAFGYRNPKLASAVYGKSAKVVDNPWQIAAGADFLHPSTRGEKSAGTDLINRYVHHVHRATRVSLPVFERMVEVQSLQRAPSSLMRPGFMAQVLAASRRAVSDGGVVAHREYVST
jgi:2-polyprenyl-6-methoxyphenol hydroxylase-like FAD-dependent oxidoreductase